MSPAKQECPVCRGNGFVGVVADRRMRRPARRPTLRPRPEVRPAPPPHPGEQSYHEYTAELVERIIAVFKADCDPKYRRGPISDDERRYACTRLLEHATTAEAQKDMWARDKFTWAALQIFNARVNP